MLFGALPGSLRSPTHRIIGSLWNLLAAAAAGPRPGHDVQAEMRTMANVNFSGIFVCCKFHQVDDLWGRGGGDPAVWCPELVNPNLIWYARSGRTLMYTGAVLPSPERREGTVHLQKKKKSGDIAALTHLGFCPSTTVKTRSSLMKRPLKPPAARRARTNISWETDSIPVVFQTHG